MVGDGDGAMITGLAYLRVSAPDPEAWRSFGVDVLGMEEGTPPPGAEGEAGNVILRMDSRVHRIVVAQGAGGVEVMGWEVADAAALERLAERLQDAGIEVERGSDADLASRRVRGLIRCTDPSGNVVEVVHGMEEGALFRSPRGVRFVTGDGGLGHCALMVPDAAASQRFYQELLGFRLSDTITLPVGTGFFYHANPRHHSLAFVAVPGMPAMIQHVMVEVDDPAAVVDAYDRLMQSRGPVTTGLGKHTNDHMFSFYVRTPSGFDIEFGSNGRRIEDDAAWLPADYAATSRWGHERLVPLELPAPAGAAGG